MQKILVTGSNGFIGKNLVQRLRESSQYQVSECTRETSDADLKEYLREASFIFHLAGINRPQKDEEFSTGNEGFTDHLIKLRLEVASNAPIVFTSSIQAERDNPYGQSKRKAENLLLQAGNSYIYRLQNVFGKWSRPNYNSAVATFCFNIAHDKPITIHDPDATIRLVYIDDVINEFMSLLESPPAPQTPETIRSIAPEYSLTVAELVERIRLIKESRSTLYTERVGTGLWRALHATYLSYLNPLQFSYSLQRHQDPRGTFVEMLKTHDSGQFSFFTAHPGVTRGGHYHHSKTEKFLILKGIAKYRFRHIKTNEIYELIVDSKNAPTVVETIPGWTHDITNIGDEDLIVMLWANEVFDRSRPDTIPQKVIP